MTLISDEFAVNEVNISNVTEAAKTKWHHFFWPTWYNYDIVFGWATSARAQPYYSSKFSIFHNSLHWLLYAMPSCVCSTGTCSGCATNSNSQTHQLDHRGATCTDAE